ncbi:hypothetical protein HN51_050467, partial [Arachis hypogaea]
FYRTEHYCNPSSPIAVIVFLAARARALFFLLCFAVFICSCRSETSALVGVLKPLLCSAVVPCSVVSSKSRTIRRSPLSLKPLASYSIL